MTTRGFDALGPSGIRVIFAGVADESVRVFVSEPPQPANAISATATPARTRVVRAELTPTPYRHSWFRPAAL
jgi:hypothetical protein